MNPIRVLIVDDSVVVRRILSEVQGADPEIEVIGTAAHGQIALQKIAQLKPDLVTLDMEMPVMDGLQTLVAIRKIDRKLPVIMFSTLTERGAAATLDALAAGANDYVTKPANVGSVTVAIERIRQELIPKIKALCGRLRPAAQARATSPLPATATSKMPAARSTGGRVDIVAIGCSTGGPNALAEVFSQLPRDLPVPIVITQHMPPLFTRLLAQRLATQSGHRVSEAAEGSLLRAGEALIAPGGFHMVVERKREGAMVRLNQEPQENSCRPAVDVMMRSVVGAYAGSTLGVILTGMGQDGLVGCTAIVKAGGRVIAQDEQTSVVWGMPGFVAGAGLAEKIVPLGCIASEIRRIVSEHRSWTPAMSAA
jgi:two-component system chemotaxis response regulator CheB